MSISIQVLGIPGEDNATFVQIDTGNAIHRLLFDCGERCLHSIGVADIQSIDHLFFSHFHMDHVCGFDTFFRHNYNRPERPVKVWGPEGTIEVIHHRMRGFTWNLHHRQRGKWDIHAIDQTTIKQSSFYTHEAFATEHKENSRPFETSHTFLSEPGFEVSAKHLNHGSIDSLAYRIDEPIKENIDPEKLATSGLQPGPWIRQLKEANDREILIEGKNIPRDQLKADLIIQTKGQSAAYLTDFHLPPNSKDWQETVTWLDGVDTMVCESQYLEEDHEYAKKNAHMTTHRVAQLAADCGAKRLIIQHISRRYERTRWQEMLTEAQAIFPNTEMPSHWRL